MPSLKGRFWPVWRNGFGKMDPLAIIHVHYRPGLRLTEILLTHGREVREKALAVARHVAHLQPDMDFIAEAALLHDIGIFGTTAPAIECHGTQPYVCHGIIGRQLLEKYGLPAHGLVCERHVGAGITKADIQAQQLPLPLRQMVPDSLEEAIICYADKFFSKAKSGRQRSLKKVIAQLTRYGQDQVDRFMGWHAQFGG